MELIKLREGIEGNYENYYGTNKGILCHNIKSYTKINNIKIIFKNTP